MANELLPDINAKGIFSLRSPFSALIPPQTRYAVKGIRKLSEIIASGIDPFLLYYQPNTLTQTDYDNDTAIDISIVSLSSEVGQWIYVPSSYIISYPDVNGVVYTSLILGVSLGSVADIVPLDALKTSITNLVKDFLGILCEIKEVAVSPPAIIPYTQHVQIENARTVLKGTNQSDKAKYIDVVNKLNASTARIIELENYIKTKLQ